MAKAGRGAQAPRRPRAGTFAGGMIGTILLVALAPTVAATAVDIGAPDYFAIMVLAFIAVTSVLGSSASGAWPRCSSASPSASSASTR